MTMLEHPLSLLPAIDIEGKPTDVLCIAFTRYDGEIEVLGAFLSDAERPHGRRLVSSSEISFSDTPVGSAFRAQMPAAIERWVSDCEHALGGTARALRTQDLEAEAGTAPIPVPPLRLRLLDVLCQHLPECFWEDGPFEVTLTYGGDRKDTNADRSNVAVAFDVQPGGLPLMARTLRSQAFTAALHRWCADAADFLALFQEITVSVSLAQPSAHDRAQAARAAKTAINGCAPRQAAARTRRR